MFIPLPEKKTKFSQNMGTKNKQFFTYLAKLVDEINSEYLICDSFWLKHTV